MDQESKAMREIAAQQDKLRSGMAEVLPPNEAEKIQGINRELDATIAQLNRMRDATNANGSAIDALVAGFRQLAGLRIEKVGQDALTPLLDAEAKGWEALNKQLQGLKDERAALQMPLNTWSYVEFKLTLEAQGNGALYYPSTSYASTSSIFPSDPNTGAPWTAAGVNALQAGVEIVS
jgi:hypothetical protein